MADIFKLLLVEDNPADVRLTQEALKNGKVLHKLFVIQDGMEAMVFLHKEPPYQESPRPDLILLDLNLPKKDGREVLAEIKADPNLRSIPVVILTTSQADEDILKTYDLHANGYIIKPVDIDQFFVIIRNIKEFWMAVVELPSNSSR